MADFVLVHGAWHGGWCWQRVLPLLRGARHGAHAVTLTGVGERAHLLRADIRLATHIDDVANLIAAEELQNVVLVGHSYAGMVITGVADRLLAAGAACLHHLVYVDAVVPRPGESWSSTHAVAIVEARLAAAAASGGLSIPPADPALFGLAGADRDWVDRRQTPHPAGVYQDPLPFDAERIDTLPRTFIDCTSPRLATIEVMRRRVREAPGWNVVELATGHDPMITEPVALARHLLACVSESESLATSGAPRGVIR